MFGAQTQLLKPTRPHLDAADPYFVLIHLYPTISSPQSRPSRSVRGTKGWRTFLRHACCVCGGGGKPKSGSDALHAPRWGPRELADSPRPPPSRVETFLLFVRTVGSHGEGEFCPRGGLPPPLTLRPGRRGELGHFPCSTLCPSNGLGSPLAGVREDREGREDREDR